MISKGQLIDVYFNKTVADPNAYPFSLPFFKERDGFKIHPKVTYFIGENGTGKSTLLEAIAIASGFNPEGGSFNFNFNTRETHSILHRHLRTSRGTNRHSDGYFLRSESFFNVATEIDNLDAEPGPDPSLLKAYGGKSLHEQSHGEAFWSLFMNRFRGNGFYVLDEPEAALSPTRQMAMLVRMDELIKDDSQFIIASHSPILIAYPDSLIYEFSDTGVTVRTYDQTNIFQTYANFIKDPARMVDHLLRT